MDTTYDENSCKAIGRTQDGEEPDNKAGCIGINPNNNKEKMKDEENKRPQSERELYDLEMEIMEVEADNIGF